MSDSGLTPASSLQRNQAASAALSVLARRLRVTKSHRSELFDAVGLRPRRINGIFRALTIVLVALVLVLPNAVAILYFGLLASDQFVSETRFTVRASTSARPVDAVARFSGIPSALPAQDTRVIASHLTSRGMLDRLETQFDFGRLFGRDGIDRHARLGGNPTAEEKLDTWKRMASASISPRSDIVTIKVRAFSAVEARDLNRAVVTASEELVNEMNDRIWKDSTGAAREEVAQASAQLAQARIRMQAVRNAAGILTVAGASTSFSSLSMQLEGELADLENDYKSNRDLISDQAPHMRVMASRIDARKRQLQTLRDQVAGTDSTLPSLADRSTEFAEAELEQKLAEDRLAISIATLEHLQAMSQQKLLYLDPFLQPTLPDEARYPRRVLWIAIVLAASVLLFAALSALLSVVRSRLD